MGDIRSRLSHTTVLAAIAFAAAGAYAVAAVGPEDIEDGAVRSNHIANNAVLPNKVADLQFRNLQLGDGWRTKSGSRPPAFAIDAQGVVHLRGGLENPACSVICLPFVLPPEIRSANHDARLPVGLSGGVGMLDINADAAFALLICNDGPDCTSASLEGISFAR